MPRGYPKAKAFGERILVNFHQLATPNNQPAPVAFKKKWYEFLGFPGCVFEWMER